MYYDDSFNICVSPSINIAIKPNKNIFKGSVNFNIIYPAFGPVCIDFNNEDTKQLISHYELIEDFLIEIEKHKKEVLENELKLKLKTDMIPNIILSRFFIFSENLNSNKMLNVHLIFLIKMYILIY